MFNALFGTGLILLGTAVYMWVGMYRELAGVEPRQPRAQKMPKEPKAPRPKKEKKPLFGSKKKETGFPARPSFDLESESGNRKLEDWTNFDTVKRDKSVAEDRKEMDEMFGFTMKTSEPAASEPKKEAKEPSQLSFEERYGFLLEDDKSEQVPNGTSAETEKDNMFGFTFTEPKSEQKSETKHEAFTFDFDEPKKENKPNEKERPLYEGFDFGKLPKIPKSDELRRNSSPKISKEEQPGNDPETSIEERLQRLARIMDQNSNKKN